MRRNLGAANPIATSTKGVRVPLPNRAPLRSIGHRRLGAIVEMSQHDRSSTASAVFKRGLILCLFLAIGDAAISRTAMTPVDRGRIVLRDYGRCLMSHDDRPLVGDRTRPRITDLDAFLSVSPMSFEGAKAGKILNTERCVRGTSDEAGYVTLRFQPQLLRGAIFRAKFERGTANRSLKSFSDYDPAAPWRFPRSDTFAVLQAIGECTVRENPEETRAAIEAQVASAEEDRAYAALAPTLSRCIPGDGKFTFSRAMLDGIFAEALYHLGVEAAPNRRM